MRAPCPESPAFFPPGFNIDSLAVGVTEDKTVSRMTIVVRGTLIR